MTLRIPPGWGYADAKPFKQGSRKQRHKVNPAVFEDWARLQRTAPTIADIRARFDISRAAAYRWRDRAAQLLQPKETP